MNMYGMICRLRLNKRKEIQNIRYLRSVAEPEPLRFGRSRCKDVKAKTCFLLLFSLFLYLLKGAGAGEKKNTCTGTFTLTLPVL